MEYSIELHVIMGRQIKKLPSSIGFHGNRRAPFQMTQMFHRIPWNIPCNSMELWCRQMRYNLVQWNSMEYSMELWCRQMKYDLVPWNSMELWNCHLINTMLPLTCMEYSMELHGTLESPNKKSSSSTGFHGIRRAPFQMTQVFHGIPWNIPWNSMELWCRQMKYHLVPWNSMEYSMEFHGTLVPPNEVSRHLVPWNSMELWDCHFMTCCPGLPMDIRRIPWNSGVAK